MDSHVVAPWMRWVYALLWTVFSVFALHDLYIRVMSEVPTNPSAGALVAMLVLFLFLRVLRSQGLRFKDVVDSMDRCRPLLLTLTVFGGIGLLVELLIILPVFDNWLKELF